MGAVPKRSPVLTIPLTCNLSRNKVFQGYSFSPKLTAFASAGIKLEVKSELTSILLSDRCPGSPGIPITTSLLKVASPFAVHLLVPGPKMIWHFGDLGWNSSLWTCNNGVVSYSSPDCKLDTKPQPQWTGNWLVIS